MESKHTKVYALKMAKKHGFQDAAYAAGYMKAIEETSAPELLEALIEAEKKLNSILTVCSENPSQMLQDVTYQKIINAIKKATN